MNQKTIQKFSAVILALLLIAGIQPLTNPVEAAGQHTITFSSSEADSSSITRTLDEQIFTFSANNSGTFYYNDRFGGIVPNSISFTLSVAEGYMFDLDSYDATGPIRSTVVATFFNDSTETKYLNYANIMSKYQADLSNIKSVVFYPSFDTYYNNFVITNIRPIPSAPVATTNSATNPTTNSVTLSGSVNPGNDDTTVVFEYGKTTDYGNEVVGDQSPVSGSTVADVTASLTGLDSNTIYHYRIKATNIAGTTEGSDMTFTTLAPAPAPFITSVSVPGTSTYILGSPLDFNVVFDSNVTVTGTPTIPITIGNNTRSAQYISGTGSKTLSFRYTVQSDDQDTDGIALGSTVSLNGGTIQGTGGISANLTLNSIGSTSGIWVDGQPPTMSLASPLPSGISGDIILSFDEPMHQFPGTIKLTPSGGTPIELDIGVWRDPTNYVVPYSGLNYGTQYTINATGFFDDAAGNLMNPFTTTFTTDVMTLSPPTGVTAVAGDSQATVSFTPDSSNNGVPNIIYTVTSNLGGFTASGDESPITVTGLTNGTPYTFTVTASNDFVNSSASSASSPVTPYGTPTVTSVTANSSSIYNTYKVGDIIDINVNFSESVTVNNSGGPPALRLNVGPSTRNAVYADGSGTTSLQFLYEVQKGDSSSNLNYTGTDALKLNGSTIKNGGKTDAVLTLPAPDPTGFLGANANMVIDGISPTVNITSSISSPTAPSSIPITFTFSELVFNFSIGNITVTNGNSTAPLGTGNGSETVYTASILPSGDGEITVGLTNIPIPITDIAGNAVLNSNTLTFINDTTPPVYGNTGQVTLQNKTANTMTVNWTSGTDTVTETENLEYQVIYSLQNNISTVSDASSNGTVAKSWTKNLNSYQVTGLTPNTSYYFNVLVRDELGNKTIYTSTSDKTSINPTPSTGGGGGGGSSTQAPISPVQEAITKAKKEASTQGQSNEDMAVTLTLPTSQQAQEVQYVLSRKDLNSLVEEKVTDFGLQSNKAEIRFDQTVLQEIQKQSTGDIDVQLVPVNQVADEARMVIGQRPVYDVTVSYIQNGIRQKITSFPGGQITLSIPYTPAYNELPENLYGVYFNNNGEAERIPGSHYDASQGAVIMNTAHLSVYAIGYSEEKSDFTDIQNHWAKNSIDYVTEKGIMAGTSENIFEPNKAMTRSSLIQALGKLSQIDIASYNNSSFTDVSNDSNLPYIQWAFEKGVIQGVGNQKFEPNRPVTREEIAVIFTNYTAAMNYKLPVTREATIYTDQETITGSNHQAVAMMQQAGIMTGAPGNYFNPKSSATRGELASIIQRYMLLTASPTIN